MALKIRTYGDLDGGTSDLGEQVAAQNERVAKRMESVRSVIGVMSGKGGVGKSLVTASLATALAASGRRVAVIDGDLNGPSLARMLGVSPGGLTVTTDGVEPATSTGNVAVMSMSLLVEDDEALKWHEPEADGFVWRGVQERGALREFLGDVVWGTRDLLLVDLPPGTQRLVELHELVPQLAGVIVVTIPSGASRDAVARSLELCARRGIPVFGIIQNMAGYRCPDCGAVGPLHEGRAGADLADQFDVPLLLDIPMDAGWGSAAESGGLAGWIASKSDTAVQIEGLASVFHDVVAADVVAADAEPGASRSAAVEAVGGDVETAPDEDPQGDPR